ncbi:MAG: exosome complex RNA-binding protein Csl4 [Candidatus Diapherotrites archaeon]|nr:exosome complex RNA-binding protein Csl4 [Candidatus Micrarchaeota archaeon]MBU1939901.1 exosome complex RNA-binding protein Csl4 [Candidatus Micrarchaeota archaeon]
MAKDKELVFPGTFLSTEEEFSPGKNAFEENGEVHSACVGQSHFDNASREVSVNGIMGTVEPIDVGTTIYGIVVKIKEKAAVIEIRNAEKNGAKRVILMASASLPVFDIAEGYVEQVSDLFRIGDIVKAEVSKATPLITDVSTKGQDLGVVKAFCTKCRQPMRLYDRVLKCPCGRTEERKIAKDYWIR